MQDLFDSLSVWTTLIGGFVLLVAAAEAGRWYARRQGVTANDGVVPTLNSAALGLLALMIGFTFSLALARFDGRREAVLAEANAIGTALLRTQMLPEAEAAASARLLRDYAAQRIVPAGARVSDIETSGFSQRAGKAHAALWEIAARASREAPLSVPVGLYVRALNDVIDMHERRITGLRGRVPAVVFLMLHGMALVALGFTGLSDGASGGRHRGAVVLMAGMLALVLMMVADLDAPQRGFIAVSQQPLLDLIADIPH